MAVAEARHASEVDAEVTRHQHVLATQQQTFRAEQAQREREQAVLAAQLTSQRAEAAKYKTAHEQRIKHVQAIAARHHGALLLLSVARSVAGPVSICTCAASEVSTVLLLHATWL
jgi:hypothetical protein